MVRTKQQRHRPVYHHHRQQMLKDWNFRELWKWKEYLALVSSYIHFSESLHQQTGANAIYWKVIPTTMLSIFELICWKSSPVTTVQWLWRHFVARTVMVRAPTEEPILCVFFNGTLVLACQDLKPQSACFSNALFKMHFEELGNKSSFLFERCILQAK